jgi:hypothetical protein
MAGGGSGMSFGSQETWNKESICPYATFQLPSEQQHQQLLQQQHQQVSDFKFTLLNHYFLIKKCLLKKFVEKCKILFIFLMNYFQTSSYLHT